MFHAKRDHFDSYGVGDAATGAEATTPATAPSSTLGELRSALRARGLNIAYQPIIDLATGEIAAMEALARWTTPSGTNVSPAVFIPMAEETGLIGELGSQILTMAVRDAAHWQSIRRTGVRVNISAHELRAPTFYDDVMRTVDKVGLDPRLLALEVAETVILDDDNSPQQTLGRLRVAGVSLMLDDLGAGYSSLAYLEQFPLVDMLKVDRSLVSSTEPEAEDAVQQRVDLGRKFGLKVCAEGVENGAQHERVRDLGCDFGQGYHFARPSSRDMVAKMLRVWSPFLPA